MRLAIFLTALAVFFAGCKKKYTVRGTLANETSDTLFFDNFSGQLFNYIEPGEEVSDFDLAEWKGKNPSKKICCPCELEYSHYKISVSDSTKKIIKSMNLPENWDVTVDGGNSNVYCRFTVRNADIQ